MLYLICVYNFLTIYTEILGRSVLFEGQGKERMRHYNYRNVSLCWTSGNKCIDNEIKIDNFIFMIHNEVSTFVTQRIFKDDLNGLYAQTIFISGSLAQVTRFLE